ncbi:unnamed protein product [Blepharisma stoltei]|uniref:Ubiquitin-like domain-containing protein n=1 Tax=Blepharisma stoltei TaxID=1481888 RepID=A0AAU9IXW2_9CILI|nr:unnamed protein product [Blepharisma stoltei]
MQILVKTLVGKTLNFTIEPSDSILSLKEKICIEEKVEILAQVLKFRDVALDDNQTFGFYSIESDAVVELSVIGELAVSVELPSGGIISISSNTTETVKELKKKSKRQFGVKIRHQHLYFSGKELKGDRKLQDFGLFQGNFLKLAIVDDEKLGKILKKLYKWDDDLIFPININELLKQWENQAQIIFDQAGIDFDKESTIYSIAKSSTFSLAYQLNLDALKSSLFGQSKAISNDIFKTAENQPEDLPGFCSFANNISKAASDLLSSFLEQYATTPNDDIKKDIDFKTILKDLDGRINRRLKEKYPQFVKGIKTAIINNQEIKNNENVTVEHPKPIKRKYKKLRAAKAKNYSLEEREAIIKDFLHQLEDGSLQLFDHSLAPNNIRVAIANFASQFYPHEVPIAELEILVSYLSLTPEIVTQLFSKKLPAVPQYSAAEIDKATGVPERLFIALCILLVFSNAHEALLPNIQHTRNGKYSGVYREWIRKIVHGFEESLKLKNKWQDLLLSEQILAKELLEKKKQGWVFDFSSVDFREAFKAAAERSEESKVGDSLKVYEEELSFGTYHIERIIDKSSLHITIAIPGWLSNSVDKTAKGYHWRWLVADPNQGLSYSLRWDASNDEEAKMNTREFRSDWFWSITSGISEFINTSTKSPFNTSAKQAEATGIMLADLISRGVFNNFSISLIGYSLGARIIHWCLKELAKINPDIQTIHDVYLLAGATPNDPETFAECRKIVKGRFVNCYSHLDSTLGVAYTMAIRQIPVGLGVIDVEGIESINCTSVCHSHADYREKLNQVLEKINYNL